MDDPMEYSFNLPKKPPRYGHCVVCGSNQIDLEDDETAYCESCGFSDPFAQREPTRRHAEDFDELRKLQRELGRAGNMARHVGEPLGKGTPGQPRSGMSRRADARGCLAKAKQLIEKHASLLDEVSLDDPPPTHEDDAPDKIIDTVPEYRQVASKLRTKLVEKIEEQI